MAAHAAAVRDPFPAVASNLSSLLGARLAAYLGGVKETRAVREWSMGDRRPSGDVERRLRLAYQVGLIVSQRESQHVVQAWFQGMNPNLSDVSPARVIRDGDIDEVGPRVIAAAKEFAEYG